jgi:CheY-like chemotaxis protein
MGTSKVVTANTNEFADRISSLRVMLAEDNLVNQQVALLMLEKIGLKVDVASNGLEALNLLAKFTYDVVMMDVEMPEMDGLEFVQKVREAERAQVASVVLDFVF